ncbi:hypothetical protein QVD17_13810 [Tagetes erecta]|uniref:Pectin acetylesterase n=1 Tax=Tagetes erecta TaxID=13708 RepID=A0AAD8L3W2_TARER|nr:hypothetical protein QVD17_13810 [Tagetes erecta]
MKSSLTRTQLCFTSHFLSSCHRKWCVRGSSQACGDPRHAFPPPLNIEKIQTSSGVKLTVIESAVAKGAVCLDGSPPAYQFDKGFGNGVNNWLVHIQGGGWCDTTNDCVARKTLIYGLGSSKLMPELNFTGILSNQQDQNPNFYNWNRVYMRYCDGSSFTSDVEQVDQDNNLYYRGARVFNAIVEELMSIGMKDAQNALLSGCSAGGLASILHCDKFHAYFSPSTRVKCVSDAGFFPHVDQRKIYLSSVLQCFYPQFTMPYINTPIFIVNSAYDTWQVSNMFATNESDPNGEFTKCKNDLNECSATQLKRLQDFRSDFLGTISSVIKSSAEGMFINTCYAHCQTDQSTWFAKATSKLDDKTIAEAVDDWFNDKSELDDKVKMGTPETSREPCPDRILDDVGGAFGMGAVGGAAFHFLKGTYNSPRGDRLLGGFQAVQMNAPRVGGSFAVWGGLFSTFDCTMVYLRQKEDPWNSIIAGAATGGFLQMRQGLGAASRSAVFGGVLLAMIEGAGIMLNKIMSAPQNMPPLEEAVQPNMGGVPPFPMGHLSNQPQVNIDSTSSSPSSASSSWFGGLFGGGKQEESAPSNGGKTQVLESFDAPNPPSFEYK